MKIEIIEYAGGCCDETILRELASYDIQCPECTELIPSGNKASNGLFNYKLSPLGFSCFHWSRQFEFTWAIKNSNFKQNDTCLDAGGSHAVLKYALAKRCRHVQVIDLQEDSLKKSMLSADRLGFYNIDFEVCSIQDYKPNERYDKIYCISVLEHIQNKDLRKKCFQNLLDLLKGGGELFLTMDIVVENGQTNLDFFIDLNDVKELLFNFGISFDLPITNWIAAFDVGCKIAVICIKIVK